MVAAEGDRAVRVFRAVNAAASPLRYEIEPRDQYRIEMEIDDAGWELGADLPLAHALGALSVPDRHQPGVPPRRALRDRRRGRRGVRRARIRIVDGSVEEAELAVEA